MKNNVCRKRHYEDKSRGMQKLGLYVINLCTLNIVKPVLRGHLWVKENMVFQNR